MIGDVELFFTTLWTVIPPAEIVAVQMGLTDCHRIKYQGKSFTSQDYEMQHQRCLAWLSGAVNTSTAKHKIVVTHHQPTSASATHASFQVPLILLLQLTWITLSNIAMLNIGYMGTRIIMAVQGLSLVTPSCLAISWGMYVIMKTILSL